MSKYLEVKKLKFSEKNGIISLEIEGGVYPWVEIYAATPLSNPYRMISIRNRLEPDLREIGMIESLEDIAPQFQEIVKKALDERYYIPHILKIKSVRDSYTTLVWEVITNRGSAEILLKDPHEHIRQIGPDAFIFIDIDEGSYKIEDIKKLDKKSRFLFEKYFYQ